MNDEKNNDVPEFMRTLCPELDELELQEATTNLVRYVELVIRIHKRLAEQKNKPSDSLTENNTRDRIA